MYPTLYELHLSSLGARLLAAATALWSLLLVISQLGLAAVPGGRLLLLTVPAVVFGYLILERIPSALVRLSGAWIALLVGAFFVAYLVAATPLLAFAPLAILISAAICTRFPATAVTFAFALTGSYASLKAFTGASGALVADVVLGGLVTGIVLSRVADRRVSLPLWPAVLLVGAYLFISIIQIFAGSNLTTGLLSFRLTGWYLLAAMLIAYAGWDRATYLRVARGIVIATGLLGAYAGLRWFIGPAAAEEAVAQQTGGAFNFINGDLRVFGGLGSGHQLGFWTGVTAPFCLGAALAWRGAWRLVAGTAFILVAFAVLASEVRGGFVGLVLGVTTVLVLYQLARAVPGLHLGRSLALAGGSLAILFGALVFTADSDEGSGLKRYTNILTPSEDLPYSHREAKFGEALLDIREHPLGQGVGSASLNASLRDPYLSIASNSLDNSYLKIAFEQGFVVVVIFVGGLLLLIGRLSTSAVKVADREAAGAGMGAAGTLVSTVVILYSGMYVEDLITLGAWLIVGVGIGSLLMARRKVVELP